MALTKIVATIGPSCEKKEMLIKLVEGGVSVFRLNLKHNLPSWHNLQIKKIKEISAKIKKPIGTMVDLPSSQTFNSKKTFQNYLKNLSKISVKEIDFVLTSFVKSSKEILLLKNYLKNKGYKAKVIAKIEAKEAIKNFNQILIVADGILIARGDLASQVPYEKLPYYQKLIIKECLKIGKPVIVATQMLKSMVENPFPTRAEISDVANAVLDYTDAVMLSEETAIGKYPLKTVKIMEKICSFWEKKRELPLQINFNIQDQVSALCYSAFQLWNNDFCKKRRAKAFLVLSKTGFTARMLSRLRPKIPIFVITNQKSTQDQLTLNFGTFSSLINISDIYNKKTPQQIKQILEFSKEKFGLKKGELVIFLHAEDWKNFGRAHVIRIQEII